MNKNPHLLNPHIRAGLILGGFAFVCMTLLVGTSRCTAPRVDAAQRAWQLSQMNEILPASEYDNDLLSSAVAIADAGQPRPRTVWRAFKDNQFTGALVTAQTLSGYSGAIDLLVGIDATGSILAARVTRHTETPGLGDAIEISRSDWINGFNGHSLSSLSVGQWQVKKDGGVFDHFTGATITPRAVVAAIHDTLLFFADNRTDIINLPATLPEPSNGN